MAVTICPQSSVAENVLDRTRSQGVLPVVVAEVTAVTVAVEQPLSALATPSCASTCASSALHPRLNSSEEGIERPPTDKVIFRTALHLTVRDMVAVLVQPSLAVNVLLIERLQPSLWTPPSDDVIVTAPPQP